MIQHLIISGGGIKGVAGLATIKYLEELNIMKNIKYMIGSSVGALLCFLLSIGFNSDELLDIALNINFSEYQDIKFMKMIDEWGLDDGVKIFKLIKIIALQKQFDPDTTFKQHYQKTGIYLTITGSDVAYKKTIKYNHETSPDMKVIESLRISMSYPPAFTPIKTLNQEKQNIILTDGAVIDPYPIEHYKDIDKKIGIFLHSKRKPGDIKDFEEYFYAVVSAVVDKYYDMLIDNYREDTIILDIPNVDTMDLAVSKEKKLMMYNVAYEKTKLFFNNSEKYKYLIDSNNQINKQDNKNNENKNRGDNVKNNMVENILNLSESLSEDN